MKIFKINFRIKIIYNKNKNSNKKFNKFIRNLRINNKNTKMILK